jgi:hypothetical protein
MLEMEPHEPKKQRQNKGEKEEGTNGDKKPSQKREKAMKH